MDSRDFYYKKDKLNQLRGFCATFQQGSITKAAKMLKVEPSTVSKQVLALERDLKIKLFDRSKHNKMTLTQNGQMLYTKTVVILQELDGLFEHFADDCSIEKNKIIRIAAHHTAMNYMLPKYIQIFREKYPMDDIKFIIYNLKIKEAIEKLRNNEIDILYHIVDEIPDEFIIKNTIALEPIILMNKYHKLAKKESTKLKYEDFIGQNFITIDKDNIINYFMEIYKKYNFNANIEFINGDWEVVRNYTRLNLGIHLYSNIYEKFEEFKDENLVSKNVKHLFPTMELNLILKSGKILNQNLINFLDLFL